MAYNNGSEEPRHDHPESSSTAEDREDKLVKKYNPNCIYLMYGWRRCVSVYNQFHQVYIHGRFGSCTEDKKRLLTCMKWRATYGEKREKAVQTLWDSYENEQKNMTNPNTPWTLREDPAADWKEPRKVE